VSEPLQCSECGYSDDSVTPEDAMAELRRFGKRYRAPLTRFLAGEDGDELLRTRPAPGVWSALEYAAHVRDVFAWYDRWVRQTLVEDRPVLEGIGRDEAAVEYRYNEQDPAAVVDELATNAERLAATFESVPPDGWDRVGIRRGDERSVRRFAERAVHEGNHHLLDIGRGLRTVRERA
jgi:hypothetical protein